MELKFQVPVSVVLAKGSLEGFQKLVSIVTRETHGEFCHKSADSVCRLLPQFIPEFHKDHNTKQQVSHVVFWLVIVVDKVAS